MMDLVTSLHSSPTLPLAHWPLNSSLPHPSTFALAFPVGFSQKSPRLPSSVWSDREQYLPDPDNSPLPSLVPFFFHNSCDLPSLSPRGSWVRTLSPYTG